MEYKQTLNMTKSGFPMRGGLPMREPDMLKHWEELDLYNELLKKNSGKPLFSLHDGPPFSNGAGTIPPISPAGTTTACRLNRPSSSRTS